MNYLITLQIYQELGNNTNIDEISTTEKEADSFIFASNDPKHPEKVSVCIADLNKVIRSLHLKLEIKFQQSL
jgi:hypothetical protein